MVCNAAEGEPGTYKDRYLIGKNPYWVLEGMLIAAHAMRRARRGHRHQEKFTLQVERLRKAVAEFEAAGVSAARFFWKSFWALMIISSAKRRPCWRSSMASTRCPGTSAVFVGIRATPTERNPALVNNVESMSHLPNIFVKGPEWFRSMGTKDTPGTMMITLSGDVKRPGIYELPTGLTLRQLVYDIGGGPAGDQSFKAVFSGVSNAVILLGAFDTLSWISVRCAPPARAGAPAVLWSMTRAICMVKIALMFSSFLAESSCGQCVPCKRGCRVITGTFGQS